MEQKAMRKRRYMDVVREYMQIVGVTQKKMQRMDGFTVVTPRKAW